MGVPAMFRWLSQKYPKIISRVLEEFPQDIEGEKVPVDRTKPNPNGEEFHNLYLDMNGIVHPCSHPEDKPAPKTEADMMLAIFEYTDRVVGMVRPRRLLYLAVDGVAPRAKMNQQRQRRFRSAQEAKEKDIERAEFQKMLKAQKLNKGEDINSLEEIVEKTWDSNAITPGTPFMFLLAKSLEFWCAYKFTTDPSWRNLKVIISDASVPGEGEHKIMNFIRSQRSKPDHDPNTRHVIYGLDADLIMLGLATHEPHFRVLREDVFYDSNKKKECNFCKEPGHTRDTCPHDPNKSETQAEADLDATQHGLKPYIWLHVNVLREYLRLEMESPGRRFEYNEERAIDDWVFMCFFVGNDFLPHLPSLEIRDQGIELLTQIWREMVPRMPDYVTKDGVPDMNQVQQILGALGKREDGIFKKRKEQNDRRDRRQAERDRANQNAKRPRVEENGTVQPRWKKVKEDTSTYLSAGIPFFDPKEAQSKEVRSVHGELLANKNQDNRSAAAHLKAMLKARDVKGGDTPDSTTDAPVDEQSDIDSSVATPGVSVSLGKRKLDALEDENNDTPGRSTPVASESATPMEDGKPEDTVRLWEEGYVERYYEQKFKVAPDDIEFRHKVAREYAVGLCWVLAYYMQGCPSWTWYYPYHYAPFAQDFHNINTIKPREEFKVGTPFKPYEQLMGVLPAASNHAIPEPFRSLMSDPDSPIVDFYPEDFPLDLNGKKFAWQGVVILPFIDEKRLLDAMATKYPELTEDEHRRNSLGNEVLMFSQEDDLFSIVDEALYRGSVEPGKKVQIPPYTKFRQPKTFTGVLGEVTKHHEYLPDSELVPPFESDEADFLQGGGYDRSMRVHYVMPPARKHMSMLLRGVTLPAPVLSQEEQDQIRRKQRMGGQRDFDRNSSSFSRGRGRGGYTSDRGGYSNDRGGYNNNRGYNNDRGYGNDRGGYGGHGAYGGRGSLYGNGSSYGNYGYPPAPPPAGPPPSWFSQQFPPPPNWTGPIPVPPGLNYPRQPAPSQQQSAAGYYNRNNGSSYRGGYSGGSGPGTNRGDAYRPPDGYGDGGRRY